MSVVLPEVIGNYFATDRANELDALITLFADDAIVHDEGHDIVGHDAIRAWKLASQGAYNYTSTPVSVTESGDTAVVRSWLEGTFPGSPIEVGYTFRLLNSKITYLSIG